MEIAKRFYDRIVAVHDGSAEMDGGEAATALRAAVIGIRQDSSEMLAMFWAPYVHTGS